MRISADRQATDGWHCATQMRQPTFWMLILGPHLDSSSRSAVRHEQVSAARRASLRRRCK